MRLELGPDPEEIREQLIEEAYHRLEAKLFPVEQRFSGPLADMLGIHPQQTRAAIKQEWDAFVQAMHSSPLPNQLREQFDAFVALEDIQNG